MDKLKGTISDINFWYSYSDEHYKSITLEKPLTTTTNLRYADLKPASFKDLKI